MRVDKAKNIAKVLKEVINDPLLTQREIAESTNMSLWAVNSNLKEVEQIWTKDKAIIDFVKDDLKIQALAQQEKLKRLMEKPEELSYKALNSFDETSFKRAQLLQGNATERKELKIEWLSEMPNEKLTEAIFDKIK